jgi:hypothetical protein
VQVRELARERRDPDAASDEQEWHGGILRQRKVTRDRRGPDLGSWL